VSIAELGDEAARRATPAERPTVWRDVVALDRGWEAASTAPGHCEHPGQTAGLEWLAAEIPGTAASVLRAAGRWQAGDGRDFDAEDWWFRTRFAAQPGRVGERVRLVLGGIATVADVYLNGRHILFSESMFASHTIDVTELVEAENELVIHCLALAPLLAANRRPRARWRTRLVSDRNLRFFRTMLLGRTPGFAPGPSAVGPYRPVLLERVRGPVLETLRLRSRVEAGAGVVYVRASLSVPDGAAEIETAHLVLAHAGTEHTTELALEPKGAELVLRGAATVLDPALWWPHTHGDPALYEARLRLSSRDAVTTLAAGRVGFRTLESPGDPGAEGVALRINGAPVFARGAVWTPRDLAQPHGSEPELRPVLEAMRDAGMNMVRVPGIACYESDAFHDLCDELGLLLWQDFMFANLDYPDADADFMAAVELEAREFLDRLGHRPSLAVLCGGSEVAQQAAMLGLDPTPAMTPLYLELLPSLCTEAEVDAAYVPSTPWGGDVPFRPGRGVANYYGVGAYLRPLEDARRAGVRFAAECLAFANVPDDDALPHSAGAVVHHPEWKRGVPRDVGAGWDFEDVRDHYLRTLFDLDPVALRSTEPDRYLELSRQVTGEVMAEVFGEWRRAESTCHGGLVLWLADVQPGAGWGVLDHRGLPKVAYHHLRRALAPVAVWGSDEGLEGIVAHVANDGPEPVEARLRVALYRDRETLVDSACRELAIAPRAVQSYNVEALLGRFADVSWAYRFGPAAQDLVVLSLEDPTGTWLISQAVRHPAGRPTLRETAEQLGVSARAEGDGRAAAVVLAARRFVYGVRLHVPGFAGADDAFDLEPGHERTVALRPASALGGTASAGVPLDAPSAGHLSALNLTGRVAITGV
jgi:beta-mannosidase